MSKNKKLNFVKYVLLGRLTDIGVHTNDPEVFNHTENLRELISNYEAKPQEKEEKNFEFADKE